MEGATGLEPLEIFPAEHAGIEVGQEAGLLQHPDRHRAEVSERGVIAVGIEPLAGSGPAVLGLVAEGEEGFLAAELGALPGDRDDLVRREVGGGQPAGGGGEGAVVAAVSAQPGQRDEDLLAVGDHPGPTGGSQPGVAYARGARHQVGEIGSARGKQHQRFIAVEGDAVAGAPKCAPHRRSARLHALVGHCSITA